MALRDQLKAIFLRSHGRLEKPLDQALQAFFAAQGNSVAAKLRKLLNSSDPIAEQPAAASAEWLTGQAFEPTAWDAKLRKVAWPHLLRSAFVGGSTEYQLAAHRRKGPTAADIQVDLPAEVVDAINNEIDTTMAQPYWQKINQTTRDALARDIKQAIDEGYPLAKLIKLIRQDFNGPISKARAFAIARTETTGALNAGHHAARKQLIHDGLVLGSEWIATEDYKTRATHLALNGVIVPKKPGKSAKEASDTCKVHGVKVLDSDLNFNVGGYMAPYPGHYSLPAGERIHCRCTTIAADTFADGDEPEQPSPADIIQPSDQDAVGAT